MTAYPPKNVKQKQWVTYQKKDGTGKHSGTFATNPEYVKVHHEWLWVEVDMPPAAREKGSDG